VRPVHPAALAALTLVSACSLAVEGDTSAPTYGAVALSVVSYDDQGAELSRDDRDGDGAELVAPLDRELYDPILIDGREARDPAGLFDAREARIGDITLSREEAGVLRATGDSFLRVRSAWREGNRLTVSVDGARFEIELRGEVSPGSVDRFLATAFIRMVRGEALLADDCRPDCIYDFNPGGWLCAPIRDLLAGTFGQDCNGPYTEEEWAAIEEYARTEAKREHCYDMWYIPRPLCEWGYDMAADAILPYVGPDDSGMVCASGFYAQCTAAAQ
jgi:hypothetical protein